VLHQVIAEDLEAFLRAVAEAIVAALRGGIRADSAGGAGRLTTAVSLT